MRGAALLLSLPALASAPRPGELTPEARFAQRVRTVALPAPARAAEPAPEWREGMAGWRAIAAELAARPGPALVVFTAPWCGRCPAPGEPALDAAALAAKRPGVRLARIDLESSPEAAEFSARLGVGGLPACRWLERGEATFIPCARGDDPAALLARIPAAAGPEPAAEARAALSAGELDGALKAADRALAEEATAGRFALRGRIRLRRREFPEAELDGLRALRLDGRSEAAADLLDEVLLAQSRPREAVALWRYRLDFVPSDGRARLRLSQALARAGQRGEAEAARRAACRAGHRPAC